MRIRELRLNKGWSQGQLAEFSGLSLRTIQRIEKGRNPTMESLKALAAVFETNIRSLQGNDLNNDLDESMLSEEELRELQHIRKIRKFVRDFLCYAAFAPLLALFAYLNSFGNWVLWVIFFWGATLAWEAFDVFDAKDLLGRGWEKRALEKRLGRKVD